MKTMLIHMSASARWRNKPRRLAAIIDKGRTPGFLPIVMGYGRCVWIRMVFGCNNQKITNLTIPAIPGHLQVFMRTRVTAGSGELSV